MVPKALYLLLIACILGTIIQMSLADSDEHNSGELDSKKPVSKKPDSDESNSDETDSKKADSDKPESDKPDSKKPDSDKPDSDKPDSDKPDSDKTDSDKPDSDKPDSDKPDSDKPDSKKPDSDKPASKKPDSDKSASKKPDSDKPASKKPDSDKPASKKPDSDKPASSDTPNSSKSKGKSGERGHDKNGQKPRKPLTKKEEIENKFVVKQLDIVLPKIPLISPIRGLKPNVDKAKEMVVRRLDSGSNFVDAVANGIRIAVHAVKPILAISELIAKIIGVFAEIASLNPIKLGVLVLQEGMKIGMGVLTVTLPLLANGIIASAN